MIGLIIINYLNFESHIHVIWAQNVSFRRFDSQNSGEHRSTPQKKHIRARFLSRRWSRSDAPCSNIACTAISFIWAKMLFMNGVKAHL